MRRPAALALWCLVGRVRHAQGISRQTRADLQQLALFATAASEGRSEECGHSDPLAALDALLDALREAGVAWQDVVARVNRHGGRPG